MARTAGGSAARLPLAVRVYTERAAGEATDDEDEAGSKRRGGRRLPAHVLIFDTETTTDPSQQLNFGFYRFCEVSWAPTGPTLTCLQEGIVHADDLAERYPEGLAALRRYAKRHPADVAEAFSGELKFLTHAEFLDRVLLRTAFTGKATVVGFNLPFDIARIAKHAGEARSGRRRPGEQHGSDLFRGGFSFGIWGRDRDGRWSDFKLHPRIAVKAIDSKRAMIGFTGIDLPNEPTAPDDAKRPQYRGSFLDLRTLAFALTDESHSLGSACKAFGVKHGKGRAKEHGLINAAYIAYARRDVLATAELYVKAMAEFIRHPISLKPTRAYSPASIGKAYLRAMGIKPILERQPDFPKEVLGQAMVAYYGGRAECRVRRQIVPVRYCDFRSMYPSVCALMELWSLLTAARIEVVDATAEVRALLAAITPDRVLDPALWRELVGLVELEPNGDILPARSQYDLAPGWQIGVNPVTSADPLWYTIPDAVAAALLGGKPPVVRRALRLVPVGRLTGMKKVVVRGTVAVDPRAEDFFRTLIEERVSLKKRRDLPKAERDRLDPFLKVLANATSYGIFAELNRQKLPKRATEVVTLYGLDPAHPLRVPAPENAGQYFFAPIAAVIAGAARLMLALAERFVTDSGGTYAFVDTDSMAIVASETGGGRLGAAADGPRVLSWKEADAIRERFAKLNPYDQSRVPGSILRLEDINTTKTGAQLECLAISAKRYVMFARDAKGEPCIEKHSEHGLGHLLNPLDPIDDSDENGDWIKEVWQRLLRADLGFGETAPPWTRRPAIGRLTVSSWDLQEPFEAMNEGRRYADQIKPFNFLLTAHLAISGWPSGKDITPEHFQLVAPWIDDPRKWTRTRWFDRYSGKTYAITTEGDTGGPGLARVKRFDEVLADYRVHPERKSLGPDGKPCGLHTRGVLSRRPIEVTHIKYVGKESNVLEEAMAGLLHDDDEYLTTYDDPRRDPWRTLIAPVLRKMPLAQLMKESPLGLSATKELRAGRAVPHRRNRATFQRLAGAFARAQLVAKGADAPRDDLAACHVYVDLGPGVSQ